ncbi:MAG: chemotaxis protein CheW, partial [Cycloclasticus sp.]|nr:chemotaxis protein CheW [Cycloclasticus sp.]MBQ0790432.1 chemotaxis protein CheW [Cycloclasticus sp.]
IEAERIEAESKKQHLNAPEWATNRFKAIVVVVNNVKLAFPAELIKEKMRFDGELKQVNNPLDWILGLKMDGPNFIAVVDTGRLLLGQAVRDIKDQPYASILTLEKSRWGIACDVVLEELVLDAAKINWREKSSSRQWLSGIESSLQLAIIDPEKMFIDTK